MKALVVTRLWSETPERASHGIFLRFALALDALDKVADEVEVVAYAPPTQIDADLIERHRSHFQAGRRAHFTVTAVPRLPNPSPWGLASRYLAGIFSVDRHEHYRALSHPDASALLLSRLQSGVDLIYAHRLAAFTPLLPALHASALPPPVVFDIDDIEHRALARSLRRGVEWPSEHLRWLHIPTLMLREREAIHASTVTLACSATDAATLKRLSNCARVAVVPNSVHAPDTPTPPPDACCLGFIGSFVHPPNADGAQWLIDAIWPRIAASVPGARLLIAGLGMSSGLRSARPDIEIVDYVDSLRDFYARVNVAIAPLRFGAGTRLKILEAAAWRRPVVSTRIGAEGLDFAPGREIAIADEPEAIANACIRLLKDPAQARLQAEAAAIAFDRLYRRDTIVSRTADLLMNALEPEGGGNSGTAGARPGRF